MSTRRTARRAARAPEPVAWAEAPLCLHYGYADVWTDPAYDDEPASLPGRRSAHVRLEAARAWWQATRGRTEWRDRRMRPPCLRPQAPTLAAQLRTEAREVVAVMTAEGFAP